MESTDGIGSICILGFGEVGQTLADDLAARTKPRLRTFDLLFDDGDSIPSQGLASRPTVTACSSAAEAASESDLVISVVTASEAEAAAASVAASLPTDTYYLDMNSVSPHTRRRTAALVADHGGRFVEAAVMAPIAPRRIASPILLGGPHAQTFAREAEPLGFVGARVLSPDIGPASAVKMCRSVIIKGTEALLAESLAAARFYGVENEVIASLDNVLPLPDWGAKAHYMISRSLQHGERRSQEMREVAVTVADTGIDPLLSMATVARQQWAARYAAALGEDLGTMLDALLAPSEPNAEDAFDG
jgi:3-hydroxyisobutyrate dehydrogenase-like beta-hydroxyacid dehydrogenase